MRDGAVFYENNSGRPDLVAELSRYYARHHSVELDPAQFVVTCGGVQAICLIMLSHLSPGDEAIIITPAWPNFREAAVLAGAKVHEQPLYFDQHSKEFHLDLKELSDLADRCKNLKLILVNSPSNPTGNVLSVEEKRSLLKFSRERNLTLVSDEMYERLDFSNNKEPSFLSLKSPEDQLVVINGFSKTYSMTGWRLGYLVAEPELAQQMSKLQEFITSHAPSMVQVAAVTALREGEGYIEESLARYKRLRNLVLERLNSMPDVVTATPKGGFYAFFKHPGTTDSIAFSEALLRETGLMTAPGKAFGAGGEGWIRICFAKDDQVLLDACDRLEGFLAKKRQVA